MKRKKLKSIKSLRNKLDRLFSIYIRRRDQGLPDGWGACRTCDRWCAGQCGHWIKRQFTKVRWREENAALQCLQCNHFKGGAQDEMGAYVLRTWGRAIFDELLSLKHTTWKPTRSDLEALIEKYS